MAKTKSKPKPEKKKPATKSKPKPAANPRRASQPAAAPPPVAVELAERTPLGFGDGVLVPADLTEAENRETNRHLQTVPPSLVRLDPEDFRMALVEIDVTQAWLGAWLGTDRHQINRWTRNPVPWWMSFVVYLLQHEYATLEPVWKKLPRPLEAKFPPPQKREDAEPQAAAE
jgi:hypothetical protein